MATPVLLPVNQDMLSTTSPQLIWSIVVQDQMTGTEAALFQIV